MMAKDLDSVTRARVRWLIAEAQQASDPAACAPLVRTVCARYGQPLPKEFWPRGDDGQPREPRHYVLDAEPGVYSGVFQ